MEWSSVKKVQFNDEVKVVYIPKDEDRSMTWLYDRKRFERRIAATEPILNEMLMKRLVSMNHGAKGQTPVDANLTVA